MKREVIVVGGGVADLTTAVTLAKSGKEVLLIEKNNHCGGLMNSFYRDGFRFDGGARALVNAGLVRPMIEELNIDLELVKNNISIIIENEVLKIDGEDSIVKYAEILKRLYPENVKDIDKIIDVMKATIDDMKVMYGSENPLVSKNKNVIRTILGIPGFILWTFKLLNILRKIENMKQPIEKFISELTDNQSLIDIIIQHFFKGTPAFFALSYFALYNDYVYPKGGVGKFTEKLAEKTLELGGEIKLNTEIVKVDVSQNTLIDKEGNVYKYNKLIWAADLKKLYTIISNVPQHVSRKFSMEKERILKSKGAESVFSIFLGVDEDPEFFKNIATGHIFYTPKKEGLGEVHRSELRRILDNWQQISKEDLFNWLRKFVEYNTFEISIPVLRDKDAAPKGKTGIIVSFLFDYELTKKIYERGWYYEFKDIMTNEVLGVLSKHLFPNLKDKVILNFSASPLTIERLDGSSEGAIVGWSFEGELPIESSMTKMAESVRTSIPNIYKAGQWTFSPAGGPTSIMTGKIAAKKCLRG